MSKFFSFFSFIRKSFSSRDLYVLDIDHNALNHLSNIKSNSDALYIQFKSKALILYEKEETCVVLGSVIDESNRKFRQLLILTIKESDESIYDNTNNKIDKDEVGTILYSWLIEDIT